MSMAHHYYYEQAVSKSNMNPSSSQPVGGGSSTNSSAFGSTSAVSPTSSSRPSFFSSTSLSGAVPPITRNGRKYIDMPEMVYPLPCDMQEFNRQNLRHLLYKEILGGYYISNFSDRNPPRNILDLGCGTGVWCASVADMFKEKGIVGTKFTGVDLVPVQPALPGVDFTFIRHNLLEFPFPFEDGEFDFVFIREGSMTVPNTAIMNNFLSECVRILRVGGMLEIQCTDHSIRSLRPPANKRRLASSAYDTTPVTPFDLHPPNQNLQLWNIRISHFLASRDLSAVPCTNVGPSLLMEPSITITRQIRRALPLDLNSWEDPITREEDAIRHLARSTFTQLVESIEPLLKQEEGIDSEEWDRWYKGLMDDFFGRGSVRGGECLEFGAWAGVKQAEE